MERLSVRVPDGLAELLEDRADAAGVSVSEYVRTSIADAEGFDIAAEMKSEIEERLSGIENVRSRAIGEGEPSGDPGAESGTDSSGSVF